jgi:hypothetical protein
VEEEKEEFDVLPSVAENAVAKIPNIAGMSSEIKRREIPSSAIFEELNLTKSIRVVQLWRRTSRSIAKNARAVKELSSPDFALVANG